MSMRVMMRIDIIMMRNICLLQTPHNHTFSSIYSHTHKHLMIDLLDRIGLIFLVLLLVVGAPILVAKGNVYRNAECRSNGGKVVVFQNRAPACILP